MTITRNWFGKYFLELHPLMQALHTHGGKLTGDVTISFGSGLSGIIGKKMAKTLGIPTDNKPHTLQVDISHTDKALHWNRCFDYANRLKSTFIPIGKKPTGYWIEQTGAIQLYLTVDIKNQGWYWRCTKVNVKGFPFPMWLFPTTTAYKYIESGKYRFHVSFSFLIFGTVLSYSGLLSPELTYSPP